MCSLNGISGTIIFTIYQCAYTIPRWNDLVVEKVKEDDGTALGITLSVVFMTIASLIHAVTFFRVISRMGAVTAGNLLCFD